MYCAVAVPAWLLAVELREPNELTGYALFAVICFLGLYHTRKRFSGSKLMSAEHWASAHVVGGLLSLALFWLHIGTLWPTGFYEILLGLAFYAVTAVGIVGYALQKFLPRRLSLSGSEIIFERIPTELHRLRTQAEAIVLDCAQTNGSDTLARHYSETMAWYFNRPRFRIGHLVGSQLATFWIDQNYETVKRYLNESERASLDALRAVALRKAGIDLQYALQLVLRAWPLVHVPIAVALFTLMVWHLVLVNVYTL
ncbi:MAG: hypothetical protein K0U93_29745 [Gammaproteobacteria bacterium]|nr:hypothetical protein [Gammaproteobacteria bacterium]